jgi:hypothetical protein
MPRRPDTFIIGGAKCGTTSLYEYLRRHPEVFMSPAKEPRYFSADLISTAGADLRYGVDEERYLALFEQARDEKRLGEASVRYLFSAEAPRLIRDFQPDAYVIAMLRNPVDMLYSMHQQRLADGMEDIDDFEQAIAVDDDRLAGRRVPRGRNPLLTVYKPRARFAEQLPRWLETFAERVHIIVFEDFIADPAAHFRRLLEFLEVDPDWQPASFDARNPSHAPRSRTLLSLTKSAVPQWITWQLLPRLIGDRSTRALVRRYRHSPINRRPARRPPMSADLRRRLEAEFSDDVGRLSAMLGRDMRSFWFGR